MSSSKVWSKFSVTKKDGTVLRFRIEDLASDRYEEVLDFNLKHFVPDESFYKVAGVIQSSEAVEEYRDLWTSMLTSGLLDTAVCVLDDDSDRPEIVSVSIMTIVDKIGELPKVKTAPLKKFFEMYRDIESTCNVMEKFGLKSYYDDRGMAVHRDYRGFGIASHMLKQRVMACKENGVPMTGGWMTSAGTQKIGERQGWEFVHEVNFAELGQRHGVTFEDVPPTCMFMVVRS